MQSYSPSEVINGTFGELWIDDQYMSEVTKVEAKITLDKQEVNQVGNTAKGYKITGADGKGTITLNKVTSYFINLLSDDMKNGRQTAFTIITSLKDPNSRGQERVRLTGCTFDELSLVNWEAKKLCEEQMPFSFTGWDVLDTIAS